jgi:purine nucleoside permease
MSAMEHGRLRAVDLLGRMKLADSSRVMILRAAAGDERAGLCRRDPERGSAAHEALTAAYLVGKLVAVVEIAGHWAQYKNAPP